MTTLWIVDDLTDGPAVGDVVYSPKNGVAGRYRDRGMSAEGPDTLNVAHSEAFANAFRLFDELLEHRATPDRRIRELRSDIGYAPVLTFRHNQLISQAGTIRWPEVVGEIMRLRAVLARHAVDRIRCCSADVTTVAALDCLRVDNLPIDYVGRTPRGAYFRHVARLLLLFVLKNCKAVIRHLLGWLEFPGGGKPADHLFFSVPNFIFPDEGGGYVDAMMQPLLEASEGRGRTGRLVTFDYTTGLNRHMISRSDGFVPFERFLRLRDVLRVPLAWTANAVRLARRVVRLNPPELSLPEADLTPLVHKSLVEFYLVYTPDAHVQLNAFRRLLSRWQPRRLFLIDEYLKIGQVALLACEEADVQAVAVQHGIIHGEHPGYVFPGKGERLDGYRLPDRFYVHGQHETEMLQASHPALCMRTEVVGSLKFDTLVNAFSEERRGPFLTACGLTKGRRLAVVFGGLDPIDMYRDMVEGLGTFVEEHGPWQAAFKLHPNDDRLPTLRAAAGNVSEHIKVTKSTHTYGLLRYADLVVVSTSTLASEAIALGKPVCIAYWPEKVRLRLPWADRGLAVMSHGPEDFVQSMTDAVMEGGAPDSKARAAFVRRHYHAVDGHTADRILEDLRVTGRHEGVT